MPRSLWFSVCLSASAALFCAGCELPHGPLRWDPVHLGDCLPHGKMQAPGPFCVTHDCEDRCSRECAELPQGSSGYSPYAGESAARGPRLTQHHQAVPLAGPGVDAPWPKFHPVPTRPVFESRCLPPEAAVTQQLPLQPQFLPQE